MGEVAHRPDSTVSGGARPHKTMTIRLLTNHPFGVAGTTRTVIVDDESLDMLLNGVAELVAARKAGLELRAG